MQVMHKLLGMQRRSVSYDWTSVTQAQAHAQPPITVFFASFPQQPPMTKEVIESTF